MLSKSLTKHFKGFGSGFAELHAKLYADALLNFTIHCKERKHEVQKHSCKNSACSQCGVTWQADAIGLLKCDLVVPSHLLSLKQ